MMKFGIETEALHYWFQNKQMDALKFIDLASEFGYDGVVLNIVPKKNQQEGLGAIGADTPENLRRIRQKLQEKNMYVEIDTRGTDYHHLYHLLDIAESLGAERVRTFIMGCASSYSISNLGGSYNHEDMHKGIEDIKKIVPELERRRIYLAVENHELETAEEMNKIIEMIGSPWVGFLYDPGNFLNAWQDPVEAARITAPYMFGTHMKDNIIHMHDEEPVVTGVPFGKGTVDLKEIIRVLVKNTTLQRMNVEICYMYTGVFQRAPGTGGCSKHEGQFAISPNPISPDIVKPKDYYLYDGEKLPELMDKQMDCMRSALIYLKKLYNQVLEEEFIK